MDELKKAEQPRPGKPGNAGSTGNTGNTGNTIRPAAIATEAATLAKLAAERPAFIPASAALSAGSGTYKATRSLRGWMTAMAVLMVVGVVGGALYFYTAQQRAAQSMLAANNATNTVSSALQQARTSLQQGDLKAAYLAFQNALGIEPENRAALHGLAEIALSQQQEELASTYWQRALQADPQDLRAEIGLISLQARQQPQAAEARLQALLNRQAAAEAAPVLYALGNLHASQSRWREAQSAFLQAYRHEPENPDYLFNLAVSLESLQQPQQARRFYQLAVDAAGRSRHRAHFDLQQARQKLATLPAS